MIVTGATVTDLERVLNLVNLSYGGNLQFGRIDNLSSSRTVRTRFRLRVKDSSGPGAKRSAPTIFSPGRRTVAACWHASGDFFAALLELRPDAVITGGFHARVRITKDGGNWEDWAEGSRAMPSLASENCGCSHA